MDLKIRFQINEYLIIQFFSILVFFIFAKPVIESIDQIKVANLFRNSKTNLNLSVTRKSLIEISVLLSIFFIFLLCFKCKAQTDSDILFLFIIISFFYYFLSKFYILFLVKIKKFKTKFLKWA